MKKILSIAIITLACLSLVACGNNSSTAKNSKRGTLTCSKTEYDEDGYETKEVMVVNYNNNKVTTIEDTSTIKIDSSSMSFSLTIGQALAEGLSKADGIEMTYTKIDDETVQSVLKVDYSKVNKENLKEVLGDLYDDSEETIYTTNKVTLDEFKADMLSDFTCE